MQLIFVDPNCGFKDKADFVSIFGGCIRTALRVTGPATTPGRGAFKFVRIRYRKFYQEMSALLAQGGLIKTPNCKGCKTTNIVDIVFKSTPHNKFQGTSIVERTFRQCLHSPTVKRSGRGICSSPVVDVSLTPWLHSSGGRVSSFHDEVVGPE